MRVRDGGLAENSKRTWNLDLMRLRTGELSFEVFARRHKGIVRNMAGRWGRRCPELCGVDDAVQEALLEIWLSVDSWDPARGTPLHAFVRQAVRFRLLGKTDRLIRGREFETRYLKTEGRRDDTVPDGAPMLEDLVAANRRFASVVGALDATSADVVLQALLDGASLDEIRKDVFARSTPGGGLRKTKAALRQASLVAAQL
jgi:DNA-directed RNA polymerase specialized sigma24 family protein